MQNEFVCPVCGNKDIRSIGYLNGKPYCRMCIKYIRREEINNDAFPKNAPIFLNYSLSEEQQELSNRLLDNYKRGIDSLVSAVCGSGKTEISLQVIQYAINCGEKVAFAVPRKDVVIELTNRLKEIFKKNRVISVYGGHNKIVNGDLIVLTTHQLYRYNHFFSLIVLDEIDAFPFKNNKVLESMFYGSLNGHYIMMSATPSDEVLKHFKQKDKDILNLDIRFHRHPLPVPIIYIRNKVLLVIKLLSLLDKFLKANKPVFVFAPTIEECENVFGLLKYRFRGGNFVHSKREERNKIIDDFRNGKYRYLVTTSVLERGVTVKNLQVIVYLAAHQIYDKGTLIQIAGRVGRKKEAPTGEVYFLSDRNSIQMDLAIKEIIRANESLKKEKHDD